MEWHDDLDIFLRSKIVNANISEMVMLAQKRVISSAYFGISAIENVVFLSLSPSFSRSNIAMLCIGNKNFAMTVEVPCRFASTYTVTYVQLLVLI